MRLFFPVYILLAVTSSAAMASSSIDQRLKEEEKLKELSFSIIPHKPNYLLPFTYNEMIKDYDVYQGAYSEGEQRSIEMKFQVSFKIPLFAIDRVPLFNDPIAFYFGYTQTSFWQAYSTDNSSPFRESNYEPEFFAVWQSDKKLSDNWDFKFATASFTHQSNGQTGDLSRSWNRIEGNFIFENNNLAITATPWYRIPESSNEDDNADLLDYYGHGKLAAIYTLGNNTFTLTSRNNLESDFSKGSVSLDWSFPVGSHVRGYVQVFSGYGNSLIEYNEYTNTIGLGISLTDWL
ncbi:phospholipase A [Psychromonas sp. PT13]|uniref:phospholipase A n=1 Tax=Psychromonas sp. PT13 TaxID=3439547 RepID=UPI003EC00613